MFYLALIASEYLEHIAFILKNMCQVEQQHMIYSSTNNC